MPLWGKQDNLANAPLQIVHNQTNTSKNDTANTNIRLFANSNATVGVFGVSAMEMQAARSGNTSRPAHAGWVLRKEGTGGRAGRVTYETLVAGGDITGDYENVAFPNYNIVIVQQPTFSANGAPAGTPTNISIIAHSVPEGQPLIYHWQVSYGGGAFANVPNTGIYASANGNTTSTLSISNNANLNGNTYRVRIALAGANVKFSSNAFLSVT